MTDITVMIKDDFDPTLGADVIEAVQDFEQVLASYFKVETPSNYDEILDKVNDMTLSDVLGVLLETGRTDLVTNWDSIQEFLMEWSLS